MNKLDAKSYIYIHCNRPKNVLYVGCTEDLKKRICFNKKRFIPGFAKKYDVDQLIYFEGYANHDDALAREVQIKKYRREEKECFSSKKEFRVD